ncbi:MAG: hypothetical protein ACFUZC_22110 [Chthoniobacteraceae bacterium]
MKSAYELAMERLEKVSPTVQLTEAQKAEITDINTLAQSRIAEKELFLGGEIAKARATGDFAAVDSLEKQLVAERLRIQEDAEAKKERVRAKA